MSNKNYLTLLEREEKVMYDKCKDEILELISISENNRSNMHVITVFDDPYKVEAASGMIFPTEISDVETGFSYASTYYTGYNNYFSFKRDVEQNVFSDPHKKYLVYSTSQKGTDINRRSYVPILCQENGLSLLTCDAYRLGLLMDKSHYFSLINCFSHIPHTLTYLGQANFENTINSSYVILKPALECAAVGVTKVKNENKIIMPLLAEMHKKYNQKILLQEYIEGYEISVPVLEKKGQYISTPPVWVKFNGDILTYNMVDNFQYSFSVLPCTAFPYNNIIPEVRRHAEQVMQFIGSKGLSRVDYRISAENQFYIFDIAALPVLADTGTCAQSFKALWGKSESMFQAIIGSSLC